MSYNKKQATAKRSNQFPSVFLLSMILIFGGWLIPDNARSDSLPIFQYKHTSPNGFIANQRNPFRLSIDSGEKISTVRLYFRPFSFKDYIFIELNSDGYGNYTGELPAFDESVTSLEYLFLWKNGTRQIVRTTPYRISSINSANLPPSEGAPPIVFTELENESTTDLKSKIKEAITIAQVPDNQNFGMRTGLFDMSGDKRYRHGYFGGYLYEHVKDITYAIQGYFNFAPLIDSQSDSKALIEPFLSQTPEGYPNVAGDDWTGVFYRTDSSSRIGITAAITHNGHGGVTVITSLSSLGRYLTGTISYGFSGSLYLTDHYDGEIWTTHSLSESTSVYFGFEDYVYRPSITNPRPPLYRIELTRPEPPKPVNWLPSILELLLLD